MVRLIASSSEAAYREPSAIELTPVGDGLPLRLAAAILVVVVLLAFSNSFRGQFVMDDVHEIAVNPAIRRLVPPFEAMFVGRTLPARPIPYLTFAVDHALWGTAPFGYHLTNLAVHLVAALAVFDLARSTLTSRRLATRFGSHATALALAISVIWAVHPLQTQAVTYVYQRIESMMGMFFLLSLAAFARAAFDGWNVRWITVSVVAAAAAMASKENAIVLPLVILAYDWCFVATSARELISRWRLYGLYAAACLLVALQVWLQRSEFDDFFGMAPHGAVEYALTQPGVILHYLRLAFWPVGQVFDYAWPIAKTPGDYAVAVAVVGLAAVVATVGIWRRWTWSWLAVAFLLALAPTSSFLPLGNVAAEYRMYLPLAAIVAAVVCGVYAAANRLLDGGDPTAEQAGGELPRRAVWPWMIGGAAAVAAASLCVATQRRNELYHDRDTVWNEVLEKVPRNPRGHVWAAFSAADRADIDRAIAHAETAIRLDATSSVFDQLSKQVLARGDFADAERIARDGIRLQAELLPADGGPALLGRFNLASMLATHDRQPDAETICREIAGPLDRVVGRRHPAAVGCRTILAAAAERRGDLSEAERLAEEAVADGRQGLGDWHDATQAAVTTLTGVLVSTGDVERAKAELQRSASNARGQAWWRTVNVARLDRAIAAILEEQGLYSAAVPWRERVLEALLASGADGMDVRRAQITLAITRAGRFLERGDPETAEEPARHAVEAAIEVFGFADPLAQAAVVKFSEAFFLADRKADAENVLRKFLRRAAESGLLVPGPQGRDFSTVELALAGLLEQVDRTTEAVPIHRKVLRDFLGRFGPDAVATQREAQRLKALLASQDSAKRNDTEPESAAPAVD